MDFCANAARAGCPLSGRIEPACVVTRLPEGAHPISIKKRSDTVNILPDDQAKFPKFLDYIKVEFPKLKTNRPIIYGLKKWGKMTDAEAARYLSWGQPPMINLIDGYVGPEDAIFGFPGVL